MGTTTSLSSSGPSVADQSNYAYTDSEGNFKFEFQRNKYGNNGYALYAKYDPNKYFAYLSSNDMIPLKFHKSFMKESITKDIYLKPLGTLKIRFIKTQLPNEYIYITCNNGCSGVFFNGYSADKNYIYPGLIGNSNFDLNLKVVKYDTTNWSITSDKNDDYSIFIKVNDTTTYTLNY